MLRAFNDQAESLVLDLYPYATTSPIYIDSPMPPRHRKTPPILSPGWIAWSRPPQTRGGWNDEPEKTDTLDYLNAAREKYRALADTTKE